MEKKTTTNGGIDLKCRPRRLLSEQGLSLPCPCRGGLFRLKAFARDPEIFALVVKAGAFYSDIVPGCLDALQAGPDDVVLPEFVLGDQVMFALGHLATVPNSALGLGFAKLAPEAYNRVIDDLVEHEGGGRNYGLASGFPYVSPHDARLAFHARLTDGIQCAQADLQAAMEMTDALARKKPVWGGTAARLVAGEQVAAGEHRVVCRVAGTKVLVRFFHDAGAGILELAAYDAKGYETRELDGWRLVARDGQVLGTVAGSCLHLENMADFDGVCVLLDAAGEVHALTPEK